MADQGEWVNALDSYRSLEDNQGILRGCISLIAQSLRFNQFTWVYLYVFWPGSSNIIMYQKSCDKTSIVWPLLIGELEITSRPLDYQGSRARDRLGEGVGGYD